MKTIKESILEFATYQYNWDCYNGVSFSKEVIEKSLELLKYVRDEKQVMVSPGGSDFILFSWTDPNIPVFDFNLEVYVYKDQYEYWFEINDKVQEGETTCLEEIISVIKKVGHL